MNLFIHNIKVAVRNLMKYKLQTLISVLSIAVGIVTLSIAQSLMTMYTLPFLFDQPYHDRAYEVTFHKVGDNQNIKVTEDIIRALKGNGGLVHAERLAIPNSLIFTRSMEFHLEDSTVRKGNIMSSTIDPEYPDYAGYRSAVSGKSIKKLKEGEVLISEDLARKIYGEQNPIGTTGFADDMASHEHYSFKVVDIVKDHSKFEPCFPNEQLFLCVADEIEDSFSVYNSNSSEINIVKREDSTEQQLLDEINNRLKPLELSADMSRIASSEEYRMIKTVRMIVFALASLILLSAVIGFFSMEFQMFRIRRRETALRIVNGASSFQVSVCLLTENLIIILLSVAVSIAIGYFVQDIADNYLYLIMEFTNLRIHNLWINSLQTGLFLLALCIPMTWLGVKGLKMDKGNQHRSFAGKGRNILKDMMLCVQIAVCIVFVCSTLVIIRGGELVLDKCNIPAKDSQYASSLTVDLLKMRQREEIMEEISSIPELKEMIKCGKSSCILFEFNSYPEIMEKLNGRMFFPCYYTPDTTLVSFLGLDVNWFPGDFDRNRCFILDESLYQKFQQIGLFDKTALSLSHMSGEMPVAGTFKKFPYDYQNDNVLAIDIQGNYANNYIILVTKKGRKKVLARKVEDIISRIEPEAIQDDVVLNFRDQENTLPIMVEASRTAALVLGGISIIICMMGIFSTITLETRSRRKEVAIRKVNGAKGWDIYRMFGSIYLVLCITASLIAIPVCFAISRWIQSYIDDIMPESIHLSPVVPIALGLLIVFLLTFITVFCQIHRMMRIAPAKIIAKE